MLLARFYPPAHPASLSLVRPALVGGLGVRAHAVINDVIDATTYDYAGEAAQRHSP